MASLAAQLNEVAGALEGAADVLDNDALARAHGAGVIAALAHVFDEAAARIAAAREALGIAPGEAPAEDEDPKQQYVLTPVDEDGFDTDHAIRVVGTYDKVRAYADRLEADLDGQWIDVAAAEWDDAVESFDVDEIL